MFSYSRHLPPTESSARQTSCVFSLLIRKSKQFSHIRYWSKKMDRIWVLQRTDLVTGPTSIKDQFSRKQNSYEMKMKSLPFCLLFSPSGHKPPVCHHTVVYNQVAGTPSGFNSPAPRGHTVMSLSLSEPGRLQRPGHLQRLDVHRPVSACRIILTHLHYTPLCCGHGAHSIHTGCENTWWGSPACYRH